MICRPGPRWNSWTGERGDLIGASTLRLECWVRRSTRLRGLGIVGSGRKGEHMTDQDRAEEPVVVGGVDTHRDTHVGAVVDTAGRLLGSAQFRADPAGYAQLVAWMESWGRISRVGVDRDWQLRRRSRPSSPRARHRRGGGEPSQPATTPPAGQRRQRRRRGSRSCCCLW